MYIDIALREFNDYNQYIKGFTKDTVRRFTGTVEYFARKCEITYVSEITEAVARDFFYRGRIDNNWKPATFRTYHKSLLVFMRWCVRRGYLTSNPLQDIEVPKLEKRIPAKLTKQDALKLLELVYNYPYANHFVRVRNHAIFATFLYTGLRKSELIHLALTDIDLENMTLFVRQGKGAKDRMIPINPNLAFSLKRYLDERRRLKRTCPEFFVSFNRNMGFTDNGLKHLVNDLQPAFGIRFSLHKLRHTFATLMLEGGCDIYSLSKMMGHSDINTTTIYLAASAEHLRSQIIKHPLNGL